VLAAVIVGVFPHLNGAVTQPQEFQTAVETYLAAQATGETVFAPSKCVPFIKPANFGAFQQTHEIRISSLGVQGDKEQLEVTLTWWQNSHKPAMEVTATGAWDIVDERMEIRWFDEPVRPDFDIRPFEHVLELSPIDRQWAGWRAISTLLAPDGSVDLDQYLAICPRLPPKPGLT